MSHWIDLIMESPVGWMSMLVILATCGIVGYIIWMFWTKSAQPEQ
ncbi:DUF3149 domain-containing protein [Ferrimonas balearica]|nr:DUF3149 domain-containing protein [Ferrimonas balearica]MBY5920691.1 DUF3149 domain-containing protein [Ferrimonas balearica]MBY5996624.1 DUF3149 domain-containing protein [Ferrimonas balearica]